MHWFIFTVLPQTEPQAAAWLSRREVGSWYPTETKWRIIPSGRRRKVPYQSRIVPGYVFAEMHPDAVIPIIHACRFIRGALGWGNIPAVIPDAQMERMRIMPEWVAARAEAERQALMIHPGDRAMATAFDGMVLDIEAVQNGIARFAVPLFGGAKASAAVDDLRKAG